MMKEPKRGARTESLSLRIDPKTKFILDFMVRVTGLRITDLIERGIRQFAEKTTVGSETDYDGQKNWMHYWHPEEGVRIINLIFDKDVQTNFEEDELATFIEQHDAFFFAKSAASRKPATVFVQVLWPRIEQYLDHWREHKSVNRWATGSLMLDAIRGAGMQGPQWPPKSTTPPKPSPSAKPNADLDDEIPF